MVNTLYDIVFISTFIDKKNIDSLIDTVINSNQVLSIYFIIVNQTKTDLILPSSPFIDYHQIKTKRLSLSKARNIGINYLMQNNFQFKHIMFPDDDTTFSDVFFSKFKECIKADQNYLIDVYCLGTEKLFVPNNYKNGKLFYRKNYTAAMSVNLVLNYNTFTFVGLFDERLGVGAKFGSGEDYDYFIRACDFAKDGFIYNKTIFNFHPSSANKFSKMNLKEIINKYINYGNGVIFMLFKHRMYSSIFITCIRPIGGALRSIYRFDFKLLIAFVIVFFSRTLMFFRCLMYSKKLYENLKTN